MHWRRKWQPTPVFLPGESQGWGSLVGFCLRGTQSRTRLKRLSSSSSSSRVLQRRLDLNGFHVQRTGFTLLHVQRWCHDDQLWHACFKPARDTGRMWGGRGSLFTLQSSGGWWLHPTVGGQEQAGGCSNPSLLLWVSLGPTTEWLNGLRLTWEFSKSWLLAVALLWIHQESSVN